MYVCMYVRMYVYVYDYVHVYISVCGCVWCQRVQCLCVYLDIDIDTHFKQTYQALFKEKTILQSSPALPSLPAQRQESLFSHWPFGSEDGFVSFFM